MAPAAEARGKASATSMKSLINRLNQKSNLWQINKIASSPTGATVRMRLGLYSQPDYVIECNLPLSGTWLFIYSDDKTAYDALNSNYFFRSSYYSAQITFDPKTNLIAILHTSMGGKPACLNSANRVLYPYGTD